MLFIDGTLSGAVKVGKCRGIGFAIVKIDGDSPDGKHGECKAFGSDHIVEVTTVRPAVYGEPEFDLEAAKLDPPGVQPDVTRVCRFVLTADAANEVGVYIDDELATGADAVGGWTPPGAEAPMTLADMTDVVASPTTPWVDGQCVYLGDGSTAYWDGTAWVAGVAPGAAGTIAKGSGRDPVDGRFLPVGKHGPTGKPIAEVKPDDPFVKPPVPTQLPAKKSGVVQDSF